ncbi:MAG: cytochrome C, partial [Bacteroidota bacterium]|nr:cytochrome C [Bacteroidota bacterium]
LEKVNGEYQGAVFRFTQGLEAGVNRLQWGPDSALYIGEVGMVGGWSWKEKQYGLQKMKYNGKATFEMLAVRAKPDGFEIELTEPIAGNSEADPADFKVQQWRYEGTSAYGGPKLDLKRLNVRHVQLSDGGRKIYLSIDGLQKEHVVYLAIPEDLRSTTGQSLWSNETWYTLNNIPMTDY